MQLVRSKAGFFLVLLVVTTLVCGCRSNDYQVLQSKESSAEGSNVEAGSKDDPASVTDSEAQTDSSCQDVSATDVDICESVVVVYVCGAVNNSGVYELSSGDRIADAIDAAGGFSTEAATEYLNLAMVVSDGMKIQVPTTDEIEELEKAEAQSSSNNQVDGSADTSFVVTGDGKPVDTNKQNSEADNTSALSSCDNASDSSNVLVNINTAGVDELCTLSGIGKSRADAIIAYRNENGPFKSIEDIKKVSGIKDKVFEQIKDSITV